MKLNIFANQTDRHFLMSALDACHHLPPFIQIRCRCIYPQFSADNAGEISAFKHERCFIKTLQRPVFDDAIVLDIAEHGNLFKNALLQGFVAAQDDDIRLDPHTLQFFYRMLGRFGLMLAAAVQIWHQGDMDKKTVFFADFQGYLSDGFQKWLRFDITDGAADFCDHHICTGLCTCPVDECLDFISDMGDDLNGRSQILAASLLIKHIPVDLAGGQVGKPGQIFVDETFIMAQVEICFRTIICHIDFPMLVGAHGSRIHIDVRVQLLRCHLKSSCF